MSMLDIAQDKLIINTVKAITYFLMFRLFKNLWDICFTYVGIDFEDSAITKSNWIVRMRRKNNVLVIVRSIANGFVFELLHCCSSMISTHLICTGIWISSLINMNIHKLMLA